MVESTDKSSVPGGTGQTAPAPVKYSIVVPFFNEEPIVEVLYGRIVRAMKKVSDSYEMILVNDGSTDGTADVLERIARTDERVVFVDLRRNFGQAAALQAGFDLAGGEIIIAMDGDLQHDPYEIPLFVEKINEGYDVVSGWRVRRADNLFLRRIPSRVANWLLARVSGVKLHDFGTTFKAYRRDVLREVRLYGDMHRYVPAIIAGRGARICEIPIKNPRRPAGKSSYGLKRTFGVALDLVMLRFVTGYLTRPLHFFGKWGLLSLAGGLGILGYGLIRKIVQWNSFHVFRRHGPLMAVGFMMVIAAMLFLFTGLMGEMLMRIYFETGRSKTYAIRRVVRKADAG